MSRTICIDLDIGPYMKGLGDALTLAWLAEGLRESIPITFRTSGARLELLKIFRQRVMSRERIPKTKPLAISEAYLRELADNGRQSRLAYLADFLEVPRTWSRPRPLTAAEPRGDSILLFPQTQWAPRGWPACYWVDLAWRLHRAGLDVTVLLEKSDPRYRNTPRFLFGQPLDKLVPLMSGARLVIGNDSFGAHLAGTLGVPTFALMGPTQGGCVFGHMPEVRCLSSLEPECSGCHFSPGRGFRAACDQGCLALYRLLPEKIADEVLQLSSLATAG